MVLDNQLGGSSWGKLASTPIIPWLHVVLCLWVGPGEISPFHVNTLVESQEIMVMVFNLHHVLRGAEPWVSWVLYPSFLQCACEILMCEILNVWGDHRCFQMMFWALYE